MFNLNKILLFIMVCILTGCSPKFIPFTSKNFSDRAFYQNMPLILDKDLRIDSLILYKTTFAEKPYEGYYVIDYSEVNSRNDKNILHYKDYKGYHQELYLLRLITYPKDSITIYFSLKFNGFEECIGFGPSYMGKIDESRKLILFNTELYTKNKKDVFSLKKSSLPLRMYMTATELLPDSDINIEKMIVEKSYEIGNNVVIDIPRIFRDSSALRFEYMDKMQVK